MEPFSAITFLGALAIFIYGIRLSRIGIQLLAGDRLRSLITSLTHNRLKGLVAGILTTLILQSSTATSVMLVGFAASGAITLTQAMGVLLGADIGTTLVVALLSVKKIADYALLMLVVGVILDFISRRKKTRYGSMIFLGFGFVFFGMQLMIRSTTPLQGSPLLGEIFALLGHNPSYAFFGAAVFTALVQNSATTLGLTIALAFSGLLNLTEALPIVLGANVGTCASSLGASFSGGFQARRVALAHLMIKSSGALLALGLLEPFARLVSGSSLFLLGSVASTGPEIAIAHVLFNLFLSLLFLPFIRQGCWLVAWLVPEPFQAVEKRFGPKYLDKASLESPAIAFANAKREILRMAEIAHEMFAQTIVVFERDDREMMRFIEEQDDKIDILDKAIKFYLAKISQENLTPEQARLQLNLLGTTSDLEEICDVLTKNILELGEKKIQKGRHFSEAGWLEIKDFHSKILENFQLAISLLTAVDAPLNRKVLRHEKHLADLEDQYRQAHLQRLHKGLKETIETSSIHLDLLSNLRRINSKLTTIVRATGNGLSPAS